MAKILLIGDLHFGEKGNSEKHNDQLLDFIDWTVSEFKDEVDYVVQLGDYFHHRNKIQLNTQQYGVVGARMFEEGFGKDNVYVLTGNHDLYYLSSLECSSLIAIEPYVTVISNNFMKDGVLMVPWVIDEDHWNTIITDKNNDYCLGHFELNGFYVNDQYLMEHGFSPAALKKNFKKVISGHYHSPQKQDNITYTGTPIPITMNEANEDHGVYVLDTDTGDLEFHEYQAVKVLSISYDNFEETLKDLDPDNTSIRIEFPDDLEDESLIDDVRKRLDEMNFTESKIKYRGKKAKQLLESSVDDVEEVENIDEAVIDFIKNSTEVSGVDKQLMLDLYVKAMNSEKGNE